MVRPLQNGMSCAKVSVTRHSRESRQPGSWERLGWIWQKQYLGSPVGNGRGKGAVKKPFKRHQMLTFFPSLLPCLIDVGACGSVHHRA